ncbi:DEAD/DEAH box helicase [Cobetia sp. L2A1]|uniref:DEAD/DEAH box helicase n=1 Tax=Cobetia sp. L2A1 TaxID=2686360 RepID=UPI00131DD7F5|nr:DEAD/DEAH box helicase family protein [Cobetia sp. L2A1]
MKHRSHNRLVKNGKTPPLRDWQARCIETALQVLNDDNPHFLCQATPGAGKMLMSAVLAEELMLNGSIDLILYLGPTSTIVQQARQQFERVLERPLRGEASDAGTCVTYQALHHRLDTLKQFCQRGRVLLIWDESHHAASQTSADGHHVSGLNQWGNALLSLEQHVRFTLALSGTPWRTDGSCLPLLHYQIHVAASSPGAAHSPDRRLVPGFVYSLREAIDDQVCRIPTIHMLDNRVILLRTQATPSQPPDTKRYTSLPALLRHPKVPYASLVRHDGLVTQLLHQATDQLAWWRREDPTAAGLVIAADIAHASAIAERLDQQGHTTCLVHSQLPGAHETLARFQQTSAQWIISVNMISEGVDLPRLRVCCYLSHIKTEQYFRQALGRIIRRQSHFDGQCDLFMLQDPLLERYAQRVLEDLPESHSRIQYSSFAGSAAKALPHARPLRQGAPPELQTQDDARLPPHRRPPGTLTDTMVARLAADTPVPHSNRDLIAEIHFSREYLTHVIRPT